MRARIPGFTKGAPKKEEKGKGKKREKQRKRKEKIKRRGTKREKIYREVNQHDKRGAIPVREWPLPFFF